MRLVGNFEGDFVLVVLWIWISLFLILVILLGFGNRKWRNNFYFCGVVGLGVEIEMEVEKWYIFRYMFE